MGCSLTQRYSHRIVVIGRVCRPVEHSVPNSYETSPLIVCFKGRWNVNCVLNKGIRLLFIFYYVSAVAVNVVLWKMFAYTEVVFWKLNWLEITKGKRLKHSWFLMSAASDFNTPARFSYLCIQAEVFLYVAAIYFMNC